MNVSVFTSLLAHPEKASNQYIDSLEKITVEYPYFQAARALYLKALKHQDSFEYNSALKHTAAYTADRAVLFDFITSETFSQHKTAEVISKKNDDINAITVRSEELFVEPINREETEAVLDPELFSPKVREEAKTEIAAPEEQLQLGKPLEFNPDELHSFTVWLKLSLPMPVDRSNVSAKALEIKKEEKFKLIDKFIAQNPKISPKKEIESSQHITKEIKFEKTGLMTETLARVYLEQKKLKKAIQAYKILSLKYPEKSGFFADQIEAIKKLQQK